MHKCHAYPLKNSPFFRMRGKKKFESLLGLHWDSVTQLLSSNCYHTFTNQLGRDIQSPIGWLKQVHARIAALLARIEIPDYVYSRKKRSYVDNAAVHLGEIPMVKTDIHRFYPSTSRATVFQMFKYEFECSDDVAGKLADICCFEGKHLPTGSSLSGYVAFFASRSMFDEIAACAAQANCKISIFVDDISVSGIGANKQLLSQIQRIVTSHRLRTKEKKSKIFSAKQAKIVTGVIVKGECLLLPNRRHLAIHQARRRVRSEGAAGNSVALRELVGRLREAEQITKRRCL
jgi:hypothetical protein